jgi:DNA-binding NarL/FixJ family response regulator
MDGLEATRQIVGAGSEVRVLMLTTFDLDQYVYGALVVGASGFLLKDVTPEYLVAAVQLVRSGDALLAPSITRRLVERFAPRVPAPDAADLSVLTPRELEVLTLVGSGLSNAELAAALTLSEATVKTHVARILAKLALRDRGRGARLRVRPGHPAHVMILMARWHPAGTRHCCAGARRGRRRPARNQLVRYSVGVVVKVRPCGVFHCRTPGSGWISCHPWACLAR